MDPHYLHETRGLAATAASGILDLFGEVVGIGQSALLGTLATARQLVDEVVWAGPRGHHDHPCGDCCHEHVVRHHYRCTCMPPCPGCCSC